MDDARRRTRVYLEVADADDRHRAAEVVDELISDGIMAGLITVIVNASEDVGPIRLEIPHPVHVIDGHPVFLEKPITG